MMDWVIIIAISGLSAFLVFGLGVAASVWVTPEKPKKKKERWKRIQPDDIIVLIEENNRALEFIVPVEKIRFVPVFVVFAERVGEVIIKLDAKLRENFFVDHKRLYF